MAKHTIGEEWRPVVGYEGRYEISNYGRLRGSRLNRQTGKSVLLVSTQNECGYVRNGLYSKSGKMTLVFRHKLVLETFAQRRPPNHECNHKNGVRHDNRLENLEWVTKSVNNLHKFHVLKCKAIGASGVRSGSAKITEAIARSIVKEWKDGSTFVFLGKKYGVSDVAVRSVCLGVTWWKETGVTRAFTSSMLKKKNARKDKAMSILSKSNSKESTNER